MKMGSPWRERPWFETMCSKTKEISVERQDSAKHISMKRKGYFIHGQRAREEKGGSIFYERSLNVAENKERRKCQFSGLKRC